MTNDNWGVTLAGLNLTGSIGGTTFKALNVQGWSAGSGTTGDVVQNAYGDGGWMTEAFDTPKTLYIPGTIKGPNRPAVRAGFDMLSRYIPRRTTAPLVVEEDGVVRHMMVRLDQVPPKGEWRSDRLAEFGVQLVAPDPRMFSGDGADGYTYEAETALPVSTGGLQLGAALPWKLDAAMATGKILITNAGDARPPVKLLLTNVVNPVISDGETQMRLGITVGTGQTLEVDLDGRTVKLNGVNRRNALAGGWITPAAGTRLTFNASTYSTSARLRARWSDAWR